MTGQGYLICHWESEREKIAAYMEKERWWCWWVIMKKDNTQNNCDMAIHVTSEVEERNIFKSDE